MEIRKGCILEKNSICFGDPADSAICRRFVFLGVEGQGSVPDG